MDIEGQTIDFEPEDLLIETQSAEGYACAEDGGFLAALDTTVTPELEREGLAREVVRTIQDARKQAGLDVADRIALRVEGGGIVEEAVHEHRAFIQSETLASTWHDERPSVIPIKSNDPWANLGGPSNWLLTRWILSKRSS